MNGLSERTHAVFMEFAKIRFSVTLNVLERLHQAFHGFSECNTSQENQSFIAREGIEEMRWFM